MHDAEQNHHGAILASPEGDIGLALSPTCQQIVERVEFDQATGLIKIAFEGDTKAREWSYLPQYLDDALLAASEVLVAHFETWKNFTGYDTSREYMVPLLIV